MNHQRKPINIIDILFDFQNNPFYLNLALGYGLIIIVSFPFIFGYQIYPKDNNFSPNELNPECKAISQIGYNTHENFFNLSYKVSSKSQITKSSSCTYFRIIFDGEFFKEEVRHMNAEARFQYSNDEFGASYEVLQEGMMNFTIMCLDKVFYNDQIDVYPLNQESKYSVFHKNDSITSISNVCFSNSVHDPKLPVLFFRNNVKNFKDEFINSIASISFSSPKSNNLPLVIRNFTIDMFLDDNDDYKKLHFPLIDVERKTTFQLISTILPIAMIQAEKYSSFLMNRAYRFDNIELKEYEKHFNDLYDVTVAVVQKPVMKSDEVLTKYCYVNDLQLIIPSFDDIEGDNGAISDNNYQLFKSLAVNAFKESLNTNNIIFSESSSIDLININELEEIIGISREIKHINLSSSTLKEKIKEISSASIMVSFDDRNEISNAIWMPEGSTLILLHEKYSKFSPAVDFIIKRNINIEVIDYDGMEYDYFVKNAKQEVTINTTRFEQIMRKLL